MTLQRLLCSCSRAGSSFVLFSGIFGINSSETISEAIQNKSIKGKGKGKGKKGKKRGKEREREKEEEREERNLCKREDRQKVQRESLGPPQKIGCHQNISIFYFFFFFF